jgi:hypothetical protein
LKPTAAPFETVTESSVRFPAPVTANSRKFDPEFRVIVTPLFPSGP